MKYKLWKKLKKRLFKYKPDKSLFNNDNKQDFFLKKYEKYE
jgi:hypothetical protein